MKVNSNFALCNLKPEWLLPVQTTWNIATDLRTLPSARGEAWRSCRMGNCAIPNNRFLGVALHFRVRLLYIGRWSAAHLSVCRSFASRWLWDYPWFRCFYQFLHNRKSFFFSLPRRPRIWFVITSKMNFNMLMLVTSSSRYVASAMSLSVISYYLFLSI